MERYTPDGIPIHDCDAFGWEMRNGVLGSPTHIAQRGYACGYRNGRASVPTSPGPDYREALSGLTMSRDPTFGQSVDALHEVWRKLGGAVSCILVSLSLCGSVADVAPLESLRKGSLVVTNVNDAAILDMTASATNALWEATTNLTAATAEAVREDAAGMAAAATNALAAATDAGYVRSWTVGHDGRYGNAVTIGTRNEAKNARSPSLTVGTDLVGSGVNSMAVGSGCMAWTTNAIALGDHAESGSGYSNTFVWSGAAGSPPTNYVSRGTGTFCINPAGGLNGMYIGSTSLGSIVESLWDSIGGKVPLAPGGSIALSMDPPADPPGTGSIAVGVPVASASGVASAAFGSLVYASGYNSVAAGRNAYATDDACFSLGTDSWSTNMNSLVWNNGLDGEYGSHGPGTLSVNPYGGLDGFWIGDTNVAALVEDTVARAVAGVDVDGMVTAATNLALAAVRDGYVRKAANGSVEIGTGASGPGADSLSIGGSTAKGKGSLAVGFGCKAGDSGSRDYSVAAGRGSSALGQYTIALGYNAESMQDDKYAFTWSGVDATAKYQSHGPGTFNVNPAGGADGFYVGEVPLSSFATKGEVSSITNGVRMKTDMTAYRQQGVGAWNVALTVISYGPSVTRFERYGDPFLHIDPDTGMARWAQRMAVTVTGTDLKEAIAYGPSGGVTYDYDVPLGYDGAYGKVDVHIDRPYEYARVGDIAAEYMAATNATTSSSLTAECGRMFDVSCPSDYFDVTLPPVADGKVGDFVVRLENLYSGGSNSVVRLSGFSSGSVDTLEADALKVPRYRSAYLTFTWTGRHWLVTRSLVHVEDAP